jgi:exodeoxyribonuclease X
MTPMRLPEALTGRDLVVVDVEGNGHHPPEIIELALLPLTTQRVASTDELRSWMVRPVQPITPIVTAKVHGITNADVADSPPWVQVADEVTAALSGRVLVAHNATVERRVLSAHLPGWAPPAVLDTLRLAKIVWPNLPGGYGLDHLITHAQLPPPPTSSAGAGGGGRHRAGYDTWMTAALLVALLTTLADHGDLTWPRLTTAAALSDPTTAVAVDRASATAAEEGLW